MPLDERLSDADRFALYGGRPGAQERARRGDVAPASQKFYRVKQRALGRGVRAVALEKAVLID